MNTPSARRATIPKLPANRWPRRLSVDARFRSFTAIPMKNIPPAWRLSALLLLCPGLPLHAQELTVLGGVANSANFAKASNAWQVDYRQDLFKNFAASIAYINEGHLTGHHRDGNAWELWGNVPFWDDRIALSLGAGAYYFYDTQPLPGGDTANVHGTAAIYSFAATGYLNDRWFYRFMANRINPSSDIKVNSATIGVGYWFGPNRRPLGNQPNQGAPEPEFVTEPQLTVFGGQSVVNTYFSQKAWAGAMEYRQGLLPHLDATAAYIYEGNPKVIRRSGVAFQLWPVNTFIDKSTAVGIGVGPYLNIDQKHSATTGVKVGQKNPAAVAPLVSLTIARHLSDRWIARLEWDRVTSTYNRDSDIFLVGLGYAWAK